MIPGAAQCAGGGELGLSVPCALVQRPRHRGGALPPPSFVTLDLWFTFPGPQFPHFINVEHDLCCRAVDEAGEEVDGMSNE